MEISWPEDPKLLKTIAPSGALKAWLLEDKRTPMASYLTELVRLPSPKILLGDVTHSAWQDKAHQTETLLKNGMSAPLNWYKILTQGISAEDDKCDCFSSCFIKHYSPSNPFTVTAVPLDRYKLTKPAFFGGAKQDYICRSEMGKAVMATHCADATIREYDAGHWVMLSNAVEVNEDLKAWIEGLKTKDLL